jgi:hypothetical protein
MAQNSPQCKSNSPAVLKTESFQKSQESCPLLASSMIINGRDKKGV